MSLVGIRVWGWGVGFDGAQFRVWGGGGGLGF